jgi:hypothetical protein
MARLGIIPRKNLLTPYRIKSYALEFGNVLECMYNPVSSKLPYHDQSPMIFYLGGNTKYMLGLNIHFIPLKYRRELLDIILQIRIKIGASMTDVQEITEKQPNIANVNIDSVLFGDRTDINRTLTGIKGIDWTAFTHLSGNPVVRVMKMGLRNYKVSNMTEVDRIEYIDPDYNDIDDEQFKVNEKILTDVSIIQGLDNQDIIQASEIAIKNGKWEKFLRERSR